jgi:hypothetical protein
MFFNSEKRDAFDKSNLTYLDMIAYFLTALLARGLSQFITHCGAIKTAAPFIHNRDSDCVAAILIC